MTISLGRLRLDRRVLAGLVALTVLAGGGLWWGLRDDGDARDAAPPVSSRLRDYPVRGELAGDSALIEAAADRWRAKGTADGDGTADGTGGDERPRGTIEVLWAGAVEHERVVVLRSSSGIATYRVQDKKGRAVESLNLVPVGPDLGAGLLPLGGPLFLAPEPAPRSLELVVPYKARAYRGVGRPDGDPVMRVDLLDGLLNIPDDRVLARRPAAGEKRPERLWVLSDTRTIPGPATPADPAVASLSLDAVEPLWALLTDPHTVGGTANSIAAAVRQIGLAPNSRRASPTFTGSAELLWHGELAKPRVGVAVKVSVGSLATGCVGISTWKPLTDAELAGRADEPDRGDAFSGPVRQASTVTVGPGPSAAPTASGDTRTELARQAYRPTLVGVWLRTEERSDNPPVFLAVGDRTVARLEVHVGDQTRRYDGPVGIVPVTGAPDGLPPTVVVGFTADGTVVPAL